MSKISREAAEKRRRRVLRMARSELLTRGRRGENSGARTARSELLTRGRRGENSGARMARSELLTRGQREENSGVRTAHVPHYLRRHHLN